MSWLFPIADAVLTVEKNGATEKVKKLQLEALQALSRQLWLLQARCYCEQILLAIAEKKTQFILSITSKTEMSKLLNPKAPHYDGVRFIPDKYHIPEEELVGWCETSLRAPLNEVGYRRYMEVFKQVYQEKEI